MGTVVLVVPVGLLRSGLSAILTQAGHEVRELGPANGRPLLGWWDTYGPQAGAPSSLAAAEHALCLLDSADSLPVIDRIRAAGPRSLRVLALVAPEATELSVLAMEHGAVAVVSTAGEPAELLASLNAAAHGVASVPFTVARSLADEGTRSPTDEELSWLQQLARGSTVAQVARKSGYAERSFYRRLRDVYVMLGKTTRTEALLEAGRQGLL
jgi:DNA-binding NarL/FixJ family response regulator